MQCSNCWEGGRKKAEGRRKKEEGRRKKGKTAISVSVTSVS
ncbi:hypothetical protein QUA13_12965 [Microcoleus sp. S28C3]